MPRTKYLILTLSVCLAVICFCGCVPQASGSSEESATSLIFTKQTMQDTTVLSMLQLGEGEIISVKIIRMGDGFSETINDATQIQNILARLGQIQVTADLGTFGYTPTGYSLVFTLAEGEAERSLSVQLDSGAYAFHAAFAGHYYEIADTGSTEKLNEYFTRRKYQ